VDLGVAAAKKAFAHWSTCPAETRCAILLRIADLIDRDVDKLALAESIDNGKPVRSARSLDIPRASANMRFFATGAMHFASEAHITGTDAVNYTIRNPIGIAACISPWNLPLYLFTWKIAPALAAGCTVVAKPSELTPMTAYLFSGLCIEAGLPPGVLNIIHGLGPKAGQALIEHPDVAAISFTGGTATGKKIAATAAPMFKKLSLELGGKNPNIVFADCDFEKAITTSIQSSFANQGEICLCGSRIFVERGLYDRFVTEFVRRTSTLTVGDPLDEKTNLGALVSEVHMNKVLSYIDLARQEGGTILTGGKRVKLQGHYQDGYFVEPTVITGLAHDCRTNKEEIFGPVVTIMPFDTEDEVIAFANSNAYGLSATIWTENLNRAHHIAARVKSGIIWVNCWLYRDLRTPFGGMKQSGVGREGGWEAMRFFTEAKNVCIKL
jgi:aminomuconate-semialdehyde/2-hydroxymuconate-6-semialdehyde dehydrogenase